MHSNHDLIRTCDAHADVTGDDYDIIPVAAAEVELEAREGVGEVVGGDVVVGEVVTIFVIPMSWISACFAMKSFVCLESLAHSEAGIEGGRFEPRSGLL